MSDYLWVGIHGPFPVRRDTGKADYAIPDFANQILGKRSQFYLCPDD